MTNYKILFVEDDINIQRIFKFEFKKAGFIVEIANNGSQGFEIAKSFLPDLIVSDVSMPETNGFEFRKLLLKENSLKKIPFVFLTSNDSDEDILQGYELEIEEYIPKTLSPKIVIVKIKVILKNLMQSKQIALDEIKTAAGNFGKSVVPNELPIFDGFEITHWHRPYDEIPGGDFIDYFQVDEDNLAIILGDVMGKRWGAWYFAYAYAGYVRNALRSNLELLNVHSPAKILTTINESIYKDEKISDVFITLSIIILNKKNRSAKYSGAGDIPLFLKKDKVYIEQSDGMLLGFMPNSTYIDKEFDLDSGNKMFLITDGILEAKNKDEELLGSEKFINILNQINANIAPTDFIKNSIKNYTNEKYYDDISLISISTV